MLHLPLRPLAALLSLLTILTVAPSVTRAAGEVELLAVTEGDFPATDVQQWTRVLSALKIKFQIRSARKGDTIEIENRGTKDRPRYYVHGVIKNDSTLQVPGGRFKLTDRGKLSAWLEELKTYGPQGSPEGEPLYGLNAEQFDKLMEDLGQTILFNTKGIERKVALERITSKLQHTTRFSPRAKAALASDDAVRDNIMGLSSGTGLAYLLRPAGMALRPERLPSGQVILNIETAGETSEPWPVGWELKTRRKEVVPQFFEFIDVDIEPIPLSTALEAIQGRVEIPFLLDRNNLVRHEVKVDEVKVSYPGKKSTYSIILQRLLGQARLTSEVRLDEKGKPFLWITTLKK